MYSTKIYLVFVLVSTTWAGILPKSRRPLRHGFRNGFLLGQIELRDPSIDIDNFVLRKSDKSDEYPLKKNEDTNELFGKDGIIYLSNPRIKDNYLLNAIGEQMAVQFLRLREPEDQESRSGEDLGLRDFRRAGGEMPKLVYDFNELVV